MNEMEFFIVVAIYIAGAFITSLVLALLDDSFDSVGFSIFWPFVWLLAIGLFFIVYLPFGLPVQIAEWIKSKRK